ncbi:hypothetical protein VTL71DRAFT_16132 [Oculimacula yallundae]|uniref:Uncharacterized protein n=1 Tax=Oculimacula yallundae TaxID=86028 RepID=A0ABR4CDK8_9HELO
MWEEGDEYSKRDENGRLRPEHRKNVSVAICCGEELWIFVKRSVFLQHLLRFWKLSTFNRRVVGNNCRLIASGIILRFRKQTRF